MLRLLLFLIPLSALAKGPVFLEKRGIVAIEAESASRKGKWKERTDVKDFSGECHLEFTGNKITSGPPASPLKYQFKIKKAGKYQLTIRARKRLESKRHDLSNDCYVAMSGDFEAGGDAPLKTLKKETKIYGGEPDRWGWAQKLDFGHKKATAIYEFKSGETYTITIWGRSKNFNFDRFLLVHESEKISDIQRKNPAESKREETEEVPTVRTLTNTKGVKIKAKLEKLEGDILHAKVGFKSYQIPLNSLIEEDQKFIREWAKEEAE